jgi:hypothetical protein
MCDRKKKPKCVQASHYISAGKQKLCQSESHLDSYFMIETRKAQSPETLAGSGDKAVSSQNEMFTRPPNSSISNKLRGNALEVVAIEKAQKQLTLSSISISAHTHP